MCSWALIAVVNARAKRSRWALTQRRRLFKTLLGLLGQGFDGLAKCQELLFGLAHQLDEDMRLGPGSCGQSAA